MVGSHHAYFDMLHVNCALSRFCRFGSDVAKSGFEFITELAMYVAQTKSVEHANKAHLDSFLQVRF